MVTLPEVMAGYLKVLGEHRRRNDRRTVVTVEISSGILVPYITEHCGADRETAGLALVAASSAVNHLLALAGEQLVRDARAEGRRS